MTDPLARPPAFETQASVLANHRVNNEYRHLIVACGEAAAAQPGQFYQLACPAPAGEAPFLRRPMSLYRADPAGGRVEFLYKVTGAGTRGLAGLRTGEHLGLLGPLGRGFQLPPGARHIIAIGRGAGLATLAPLAEAARAAGADITAILSARRPELVVSQARFAEQGARVITVTDSEANSGPSHVERLLRGLLAERACDGFYSCGSARLLRVQQALAREFCIPGQVALEQQMACGLGMCFCCVRDFNDGGEIIHKRVCWDGPVFDMLEALP